MSSKLDWWKNRWNDLIEVIRVGFPYIVLALGLVMTVLGMAGTFKISLANETIASIGKVFLGTALFTFMIKSFQYSGVFKAELTKIIFEPQYLETKKDLPIYWDKLSRVLFEDKFKGISHKLLTDIRDKYLPTNSIMYYEDSEHVIEIILNNKTTGEATLKRKFTFNAVAENPKELHAYTFGISIPYKTNALDLKYKTEVKVDGDIRIDFKDIPDFTIQDGALVKQFSVELTGRTRYKIIRTEEINYNLYYDNILFFQANKIYNNLRVDIHYPKNYLNIEFKKCGTLLPYIKDDPTSSTAQFMYNGIIYPEQGYYINIKQVKPNSMRINQIGGNGKAKTKLS
ncbi:MAG: hypothetical protein P4L41_09505 [Flavipsychrobacter sp.]|nr:hypothetical protein [Flavipsychrobacter sp.]